MASGIRISNVRYRYPGGKRPALDGLNLSVEKGEYLVVCGANGSGKSTAACLFNGLIPHFHGGKFEGNVRVFGTDSRETTVSELFTKAGLVLQNADAQLFNGTVEDELAFGLESLCLPPEKIRRKINETARLFDIEHLLKRSPDRLSGGEKRLVGIASIFCLGPSVIVFDEPYANLDRRGANRVRENLKMLHDRGIAVVVVEQRPEKCLEDAERCIVMDNGVVLFDGPPEAARHLLSQEGLIPDYYSAYGPTERNRPENDEIAVGTNRMTAPFLKVENLSRTIDGTPVLKNVSLEIHQGEAIALVGRNGSGKTTLVKHLNGLYPPQTGGVYFDGESIRTKTPMERATLAGVSFQNPNDQFFKPRVEDELRVGLGTMRGNDEDSKAWQNQIRRIFELDGLMERSPFKLSEGEKKRVAVCSILAMRPRLLVLDEPTAGQDGRQRLALARILRELNQEGTTLLVATHDLDFARAVARRWIALENGAVIADAPYEEIRWK